MKHYATRFAHLSEQLTYSTKALVRGTGFDATTISRFRTGRRLLCPGSQVTARICDFFIQDDALRDTNRLAQLLQPYYPSADFDNPEALRQLLEDWLCAPPPAEILQPSYSEDDSHYMTRVRVYTGLKGMQKALNDFVDLGMDLEPGKRMMCACHDKFEWILGNSDFTDEFLPRMFSLVEKNCFPLWVMVHADYENQQLDHFTGKWLTAHLRGLIQSYYYDDTATEFVPKMFFVMGDHLALRIINDASAPDCIYASLHTDPATVRQVAYVCQTLKDQSQQRFTYHFFDEPRGVLKPFSGKKVNFEGPYMTLQRLPLIGVVSHSELGDFCKTDPEQTALMSKEFMPLFHTPDTLPKTMEIRHMYCIDMIERVLSSTKSWMPCPDISDMTRKKVRFTKEQLITLLARVRRWLDEKDNFEVVLLPRKVYDAIGLYFFVLGKSVMVGWTADGNSTVTIDKLNAGILSEYCENNWNTILLKYRDRDRTIQMLDGWLGEYSYDSTASI